jgi:hypothetical protein
MMQEKTEKEILVDIWDELKMQEVPITKSTELLRLIHIELTKNNKLLIQVEYHLKWMFYGMSILIGAGAAIYWRVG